MRASSCSGGPRGSGVAGDGRTRVDRARRGFDRGRSPLRWLAGDAGLYAGTPAADVDPQIARADARPATAANALSSSPLRRRSSWATIGASASTTSVNPSSRSTRQAPAAAGTRSATSASNVAIARDRRSSSSSPRPRAASGMQVADPDHRPLPLAAHRDASRRARPAADEPRAVGLGADLPGAWRSPAARGRGRRASSSSRTPGAAPRSAGRGATRRSGSSSEKTSSSRRSGGRPSSAVSEVELGQLEGEDRGPLLAARRERRRGRGRRARRRGRRGAGRSSVEPFQTSFSAVSTSRRASASRGDSPGSGGAFVA